MKIKDLEGLNPEADIVIVMPDFKGYKDNLSLGWASDFDCSDPEESKDTSKEVFIHVGCDLKENIC